MHRVPIWDSVPVSSKVEAMKKKQRGKKSRSKGKGLRRAQGRRSTNSGATSPGVVQARKHRPKPPPKLELELVAEARPEPVVELPVAPWYARAWEAIVRFGLGE